MSHVKRVLEVAGEVLDHLEEQARTGVRYRTPSEVWQAASDFAPGCFAQLAPVLHWQGADAWLLRQLQEAYVSGLPPVAVGSRVKVTGKSGVFYATVTSIKGDGLLVCVEPEGVEDGTAVRRLQPRLCVDAV